LPRRALAKARAAAGLAPRQRGGQPGNRNRLIHGRYSQAFRARRQQTAALLLATRALLDELKVFLAARRGLAQVCGGSSTLFKTICHRPLHAGDPIWPSRARRNWVARTVLATASGRAMTGLDELPQSQTATALPRTATKLGKFLQDASTPSALRLRLRPQKVMRC
jgi:hypothetical protein